MLPTIVDTEHDRSGTPGQARHLIEPSLGKLPIWRLLTHRRHMCPSSLLPSTIATRLALRLWLVRLQARWRRIARSREKTQRNAISCPKMGLGDVADVWPESDETLTDSEAVGKRDG